jgi:hypothetical protein
MNSSVKFFDPIVSLFDRFAGLRWISFDVAAMGSSVFDDSAGSSPLPPQAARNRHKTMGAAARRSMRARLSPARQTTGGEFAQG